MLPVGTAPLPPNLVYSNFSKHSLESSGLQITSPAPHSSTQDKRGYSAFKHRFFRPPLTYIVVVTRVSFDLRNEEGDQDFRQKYAEPGKRMPPFGKILPNRQLNGPHQQTERSMETNQKGRELRRLSRRIRKERAVLPAQHTGILARGLNHTGQDGRTDILYR